MSSPFNKNPILGLADNAFKISNRMMYSNIGPSCHKTVPLRKKGERIKEKMQEQDRKGKGMLQEEC